jgi:hypothetical protein
VRDFSLEIWQRRFKGTFSRGRFAVAVVELGVLVTATESPSLCGKID